MVIRLINRKYTIKYWIIFQKLRGINKIIGFKIAIFNFEIRLYY